MAYMLNNQNQAINIGGNTIEKEQLEFENNQVESKFWTDKHGREHKRYIKQKGEEITQCKYDEKQKVWKLIVKRKKSKVVPLTSD